MEPFLVKLLYLVRPLLGIKTDLSFAGLNSFEFFTIAFIAVLGLVAAFTLLRKGGRQLTAVEIWMLLLIIWCVVNYLFYFEVAVFKTLIKWVVPFFTYMVLRRAILNRDILIGNLELFMVVTAVPVVASALLIAVGKGVDEEVYWTGFVRYAGLYNGAHEMGHTMGFTIMLAGVYVAIVQHVDGHRRRVLSVRDYLPIVVLVLFCLYCIYFGQVRTVMLGIAVFAIVYLYFYTKIGLALLLILTLVSLTLYSAVYSEIFYDFVSAVENPKELDKAGSGRLTIWKYNLEIFNEAPFEQRMIGLGVGNWYGSRVGGTGGMPHIVNSHNDWLQTMIELGIVGLLIMIGLYLAVLRAILRIPTRERYALLALWCAVVVMNLASNSYISRPPIAQMMFMVLVYAELPARGIATAAAARLQSGGRHARRTADPAH